MLIYIAIFLSTLAADFAWTKYNMHSAAKHAHRAAAWSATIILFGAINVMSYTANHWLVIPALLGAYVGTYLAIWWEKRGQVEEFVQLFGAANMHWSKDPKIPYDGCTCRVCDAATLMGHAGIKPPQHTV
jgi:hypothetical protein